MFPKMGLGIGRGDPFWNVVSGIQWRCSLEKVLWQSLLERENPLSRFYGVYRVIAVNMGQDIFI